MTEQAFDTQAPCESDEATPRIAILDETTANQIAAGEVIERPASAVKELVENAVDAGAKRIIVELAGSGRQMIRVTDDGCGMSQEDAILSLQRHATSKIRTAGDLAEVVTMGFRGEALPSIASVSRTTIVSRAADAPDDRPGTSVSVLGGGIESVDEIGARPGTSITVENLFYNVPARLKFLKTDTTELHHIVDLVQRQALARPEIAFRVMHTGQEIFSSPGSGSLADVCLQVYGRSVARQLLPIEYASGMGVRVTGMLGPPETMRGTRAGQHFFVNRRHVRDRAIARALDEGYRAVQTIHGQRYPIGAIFVEVDPSAVDVNVSPTKTEVRFLREREVFSAVYRAVQRTLVEQGGLTASINPQPVAPPAAEVPDQQTSFGESAWQSPFERKGDTFSENYRPLTVAEAIPPTFDPFDDAPEPPSFGAMPDSIRVYSAEAPSESAWPSPQDERGVPGAPDSGEYVPPSTNAPNQHRDTLRGMRVLAQTRNMYILAQTEKSLLLIDQHIAHERILYERLLKGQAAKALAVQHLVIPIPLELGRREALLVEQRLPELARAGFVLETFGEGAFLIRAAPAQVAQRQSVERVMRAIVDELVEKSVSRRLTVPAEEVLITASCKMAVKAGDPLNGAEMQALMDDLLLCDNPYTCPHGRPIIIEMANHDLDRKFGRI